MHRHGAAPRLRQQHSGLRKDGGRQGRPDHQLRAHRAADGRSGQMRPAQRLADRAGNTAGESQDCRYRPRPRHSLHSRSKQSGARLAALTRQFDKTLATVPGR
jgi:hypothetical protein